jgi:hypothetical protein
MGSNFDSVSVVNWNGSPRATTFSSSTQLTALILPQDAAFAGPANVAVSNAAGPSNSVVFTMTTPATSLPPPVIVSLSQTNATHASPTFTLGVTGNSFVPCSAVKWNGNVKATTYVSPTQITATVPAADIFSAGTANVTVSTPTPGGGTSGAILFTIQ